MAHTNALRTFSKISKASCNWSIISYMCGSGLDMNIKPLQECKRKKLGGGRGRKRHL